MLKLGVDAWNLPGDHRGIGRYVRAILREWREHFAERVEVTLIVPEWHTWTVRERYRREVAHAPYRVVSRALHRRARFDVLWFPWNGCSWTTFDAPAVATLHDATNFALDAYAPETQTIFRAAAATCRRLITDSVFSQHELARALELPLERIVPILLGVEPPEAAHPARRDDIDALAPFVLFVGTTERRKGVDVLIDAMARVQQRYPELRLVLAGARGDAVASASSIRCTELGWVDDATLQALYDSAALFAFPSRYEGFGLPPLEAMAHGVPVVSSDQPALLEAVGDAASIVPMNDAAALADAITRVYAEPALAAALRARGRARAAEMSWTNAAAAALAVLEEAARA